METGYQEFIDQILKRGKEIVIYGNGKLAKSFYQLLLKLNIKIAMFVVSKYDTAIREYEGIPVKEFESIRDVAKNYSYVLAIENANLQKILMDKILMGGGESIFRMDWKLIQEVYANFCIDIPNEKYMINILHNTNKIAIYGAGKLGKILHSRLKVYGLKVEFFCVTDKTGNVESIDGTPVYLFENIKKQMKGMSVIIAMENFELQKGLITPLRNAGIDKFYLLKDELIKDIYINYRKDILKSLEGYHILNNFENIEINHSVLVYEKEGAQYRWRIPDRTGIPYTDQGLDLFRTGGFADEFESQYGKCDYLSYTKDQLSDIKELVPKMEVYMAKYYKDTQTDRYKLPDWVLPIQVGAALTNVIVADIADNTGDNISTKNVDYSEGTALYWMWKNTRGQDYVGLFHYRRHMVFDNYSIQKLVNYDIVLTLPTLITENIYNFFTARYIMKHDWKLMMETIRQFDEELYQTAVLHEASHFYFPCNIFIMKRSIFDKMCFFIFEILEKVDEFYKNNCIDRKDRYLGYLIENLVSIYVKHNSKKMKLAYTDMKFYNWIN